MSWVCLITPISSSLGLWCKWIKTIYDNAKYDNVRSSFFSCLFVLGILLAWKKNDLERFLRTQNWCSSFITFENFFFFYFRMASKVHDVSAVPLNSFNSLSRVYLLSCSLSRRSRSNVAFYYLNRRGNEYRWHVEEMCICVFFRENKEQSCLILSQ